MKQKEIGYDQQFKSQSMESHRGKSTHMRQTRNQKMEDLGSMR